MSEAGIDVSAYQSGAGEGSTGFAQLLRAEWKKFRTIRGWLVGMITAALVTVAIAALDHASCGGVRGIPALAATDPVGRDRHRV